MSSMKKIEQLLAQRAKNKGGWGQGIDRARWTSLQEFAGHHVLDVGCSGGAYVRQLRESGYVSHGTDLLEDPRWLNSGQRLFVVSDANRLPFPDNSFDTVIAFEVLEHIEDVAGVLREFKRVAQKNIIISVPNCDHSQEFVIAKIAYHHWVDPTHVQFFTQNTLASTLTQAGFSVQSITYVDPIYPELFVMQSWGVPFRLAVFLQRVFNRVPFRKKYHLGILATAVAKH
jgi:2-polyprenyl-3-methyl-5-hydroxy-6-metoxy-1,4-benzoquinol methylase